MRPEYTGGHRRGFSCDAGDLRAWDRAVTGSGFCLVYLIIFDYLFIYFWLHWVFIALRAFL